MHKFILALRNSLQPVISKIVFTSFVAVLASSSIASASATTDVADLLESNFRSSMYVETRCHENIRRLIRAASDAGIDLNGFSYVEVHSNFTAPYLEGFRAYETLNRWGAQTSKNWYFHVILLSPEGLVYDFDFGLNPTGPTILPAREYFERQFFPASIPYKDFYDAVRRRPDFRDKVLDGLELQIHPAASVLGGSPEKTDRITLRQFLAL